MEEKRRRRVQHRPSRGWQSFRIGAGFHFIDRTQSVLSDTIETSAVILQLWQCYASRVLSHLRRTKRKYQLPTTIVE